MQLEIRVGILLPSYHNNTNITQKNKTHHVATLFCPGGGGYSYIVFGTADKHTPTVYFRPDCYSGGRYGKFVSKKGWP